MQKKRVNHLIAMAASGTQKMRITDFKIPVGHHNSQMPALTITTEQSYRIEHGVTSAMGNISNLS
jgi:hypothetical protein